MQRFFHQRILPHLDDIGNTDADNHPHLHPHMDCDPHVLPDHHPEAGPRLEEPRPVQRRMAACHRSLESTRLYASGGYGSIYRSENGGSTWIPVKNDPISVYLGSSGNVLADRFAIDPFNASYLYVLSSNGMERSSDFGSNWQTVAGEPHKRYDTFAVSPTEPSAVFVAYTDTKEKDYHNWTAGLLFSWDRGGHWGIVNDHLSKGLSHVTSIIFDPTDLATMYLGTNGDGVLKSIDGGKTWKAKNSGLPGSPACCEYHGKHFINSMIIDPLIRRRCSSR